MIPPATTNLKADMSRVPFTNDQRFFLLETLIIVMGIIGLVYTLKH